MSARRRRKQEQPSSSGAERPAREPILRRYSEFLLMALVVAAGAIFLALLLSPSSFYSAVTHKESGAFYRQPEGGAQRLQAGRNDLQRSIYQSMSTGSALRCRSALDLMLRTIADSEQMDVDASSAMDAYRRDPHNDLTRLVSAMVFVLADAPPAQAGGLSPETARALYDKLSTVLELTTATGVATTFHMDVVANMRAVYRAHFSRPDVALQVAEIDAPYFVIQPQRYPAHWDGFPAMQRRLGAIAASLEAVGQHREAAKCRAWFHRPMLELIEREPDTPMRLLCLDLLIRNLPETSPARASLTRMRDEFVQHAADAPVDRTDLTGQRTAVAPAEYRAVQAWLIAAIVLALVAAGAGGAYVVALALGPFIGGQRELAPRSRSPQGDRWVLGVRLILLGGYVCTAAAAPRGPFSDHWTLHMMILSVWAGLSVACAFSGFHDRPIELPWIASLAFILPLAPIVLYFVPPRSVVEFSRYMDQWMHPMWAGIGIASIGAVVAFALNCRRLRAIRKTAALICATTACFTMAAYAVHSVADVNWQEAAVPGRLDEFTARLGDGWWERLLVPLKPELLGIAP